MMLRQMTIAMYWEQQKARCMGGNAVKLVLLSAIDSSFCFCVFSRDALYSFHFKCLKSTCSQLSFAEEGRGWNSRRDGCGRHEDSMVWYGIACWMYITKID